MALWNKQYPVDTTAGGDTIYDGFVKAESEFDNVYDKLNQLRIARAGTTPPADAEVNELWLDTSVTPPILKRYDGTSWVDVEPADLILSKILTVDGEGSGLDADLIRGLPGDFTNSIVSSGYQKLPSGLIIQWGQVTNDGTGLLSVTFPIAFPNACFSVTYSDTVGIVPSAAHTTYINNITTTGMQVDINNSDGAANTDTGIVVSWIAIGY
jgi:hypothetical protein